VFTVQQDNKYLHYTTLYYFYRWVLHLRATLTANKFRGALKRFIFITTY